MEQHLKNLTFGKATMVSLVLAAIYYFTVYNDGASYQARITAGREQMAKNKAEINTVENAIRDAERYKQTMAVRSAEMEGVLKAVPAQLSSFDMMKIVSNESKSVGLQINNLTPALGSVRSGEKKDIFFEPVAVSVNLTGNYNQVMLFLSNLTKLDKIITVRQMSFTARLDNSKKSAPPIITFVGELDGYKYIGSKPEEAKPAAAAAPPKKDE